MTIASEITRLQGAKADIKTAIEGKGVEVPSTAKLDTYDEYINQIQQGSDFYGTVKYVAVLDTNIPDASRLSSSLSGGILGYKNGKWLVHGETGGWYYIGICSYGGTGYDYGYFDSRYLLTRNAFNDPVTGQLFLSSYYNGGWGNLIEITELTNTGYGYTGRTICSRNDNRLIRAVGGDVAFYNGFSYPYLSVFTPSIKGDYTSSYASISSIGERTDSYWHILLPYLKNGEVNYYYGKVYSYDSTTAKNIPLYRIDGNHNISSESIGSINVTGTYLPFCTSIDGVILVINGGKTYVSTEEGVGAATGYIINTDGTNFAPGSIYWCEETGTYCSGRYKLVPIEDYIRQQGFPIRWWI